jgi:hypothetical protein
MKSIRFIDVVIIALVILSLVFFFLFLNEAQKNKLKDKVLRRLMDENDELKRAYLDLLQAYLLQAENTPQEIIKDIERLKEQAVELSKDVHIELGSVIDNVRANKGPKAVRELGKIIENLLKEKAKQDTNFKKKPTLGNLIEHAKSCLWIKPNEAAYASLLHEIRNMESHELNVKVESHKLGLAIYAGIDIIYNLRTI